MKKIILVLLLVILIVSVSACGPSDYDLQNILGVTCFDKYYTPSLLENPFPDMTLGEILLEYRMSSDVLGFSYFHNEDIPYFDKIKDEINYEDKKNNYICVQLSYNDEQANFVFSINKKTQEVLPIGFIENDGNGEIEDIGNPKQTISVMYMYMAIRIASIEWSATEWTSTTW